MFIKKIIPIFEWLPRYRRQDFGADLIAGSVVLFVTVPQVIAYAFLAGLPAETGLYATILALLGYAAFGSSRSLAVGPAAIIAMMTLEAVSEIATPGTEAYSLVAAQLALVTGVILLILRAVNFGAVVSFLSHAVVSGFITAAAILIMTNQLPTMLGLGSAADTGIFDVLQHLISTLRSFNSYSLGIGLGSMLILWLCRSYLQVRLVTWGMNENWASAIARSSPMYAVVISVGLVFSMNLSDQLPIVGEIPTNLPGLTSYSLSLSQIERLVPSALLIAMVVFLESTSIGTAVASKRREKIEPNQELVGLGFANIGSSLVGGFPVAGSFARTVVNFSSGATSQIASLITAGFVLITLVGFGWFFYYLPKSVLSAIIILSAWQLIDWHGIAKIFAFNITDTVTFIFTFVAVLVLGVESGIMIGIGISFVLLIRSSSKPHIAIVGRWQGTAHFRNVLRHDVDVLPHVLAIRIDESFYFVNSRYIETFVLNKVADNPELEHILLSCTGTNFIDISGLEMLELLSESLEEVGVTLHLAEVKGPVMDKLKETEFYQRMSGEIFFTTDIAMKALAERKSNKQVASD